ncbi:putative lipid II flippase FtsW [Alicyclobacillus mali]|uniref:Probable peptidoglycan glycosyltransferase FtsW n=1 Tax=Alicyclobacillus mali (ex Roth et al. 2021) TaxID=1123961 RepID=A0ABS0F149_9BACL|nr:putative lipid II flippase FtsW [Alicyclobacillus mali (ex Roth et al. 2021)]MCL6488367.1 putative lipid II flippase FtsW [Alicyclobacillus mali (ex Roth et al. 2021)]
MDVRTERHQPDYVLFIAVLMLTGIGVVTVYSASMVYDIHQGLSPDHFAIRQLVAAILGLAAMGSCTFIPYHVWYQHAPRLMLAALGLLLVVMIPGIGHRSLGATRWIGTTSVHIQPSEIALTALVVYLSYLLTRKLPILRDLRRTFRPAMIMVALTIGLVFIEPDMGTALCIFLTAMVLLFAAGVPGKPLGITFGASVLFGLLGARMAEYRSSRLVAFFHPFQHPKSSGYQLIQGLTAIANGGLTGRGFASSVSATGYLPEAYTDFIFAVFTEEWGWLGDLGLLAIFAVVIWRGFHIARYARDRFGSLLAIGLTASVIVQTLINLGAVTWLLPVTGIPLPFISYGGTDLVMNLAAMGILLSVSRETELELPEEDTLADIISVDEIRATRREVPDRSRRSPGRAHVARLSNLRTSPFRKTGPSDRGASLKQADRPISLSWRASRETAATKRRDERSRKPGGPFRRHKR